MEGGNIPILVLVLLVDAAHESSRRRQDLVDEDEDGLLGRQLNALADDIDKLANREVRGDEVFLLVDGGDIRLFYLLADHLQGHRWVSDGRTDGWADGQTRVVAWMGSQSSEGINLRECDQRTSGEYARPRPCASRRGARP